MVDYTSRKMIAIGIVAALIVGLFRRPIFFIFDFHWLHWDVFIEPILRLSWFFIGIPATGTCSPIVLGRFGEQDASYAMGVLVCIGIVLLGGGIIAMSAIGLLNWAGITAIDLDSTTREKKQDKAEKG